MDVGGYAVAAVHGPHDGCFVDIGADGAIDGCFVDIAVDGPNDGCFVDIGVDGPNDGCFVDIGVDDNIGLSLSENSGRDGDELITLML